LPEDDGSLRTPKAIMTSSGMARTFIVLKGVPAPEGFTANMNYCLCHGRDWGEKGAVLSEIAQASRRQYDPDIGRLSDDMPRFCTLAGFNSRCARRGATIRRLQRLGLTSL
jgi:hypothetical protein